ncbi:MAG: hypothetical protein MJZ33_07200 [Paludibacteraceae bacterium]|nr:hypothetical protein [Paludibacteraceae bacterium]
MKNIEVEKDFLSKVGHISIGVVDCKIQNSSSSAELWQLIDTEIENFKQRYTIPDLAKRPTVEATRTAYKQCGKDPSRYRPSSEALCRRILKGLDLYRINTVVDLINLISITSGYSIGGFDADKIEGEQLTLGIGREGEPFEGIGRGPLNIDGLPVYRDNVGGVGTPTSDNERTKLAEESSHLLMIVNAYSGTEGLNEFLDYSVALLKQFAEAKEIEVKVLEF